MKIIYCITLNLIINFVAAYAQDNEVVNENEVIFEEFLTTEDPENPIKQEEQGGDIARPKTSVDTTDSTTQTIQYNSAKIIALNKITAKSEEIILKSKEAVYFGNIEITLHRCLKKTDPYAPDNLMLLSIVEHKTDEDPALLFQGWMFSSSIGLSNFEHPIYEIFAKDCL